jgi:hypothetical protein
MILAWAPVGGWEEWGSVDTEIRIASAWIPSVR